MIRSTRAFALTALALACGTVSAHPSFFLGSNKISTTIRNATGATVSDKTANNGTRGWVDGVRIGHGCALTNNETGAFDKGKDASGNHLGWEKPVAYSAYIFPTGEGTGTQAPWSQNSVGTDPSIGNRPAVARITNYANDGKDAYRTSGTQAYIGTATTLASELEFKNASGTWGNLNSLRGFITPLGNNGYYNTSDTNLRIDGFVNSGPIIRKGSYVGVDYASTSLPGKFGTAVQIGGGGSGAAGSLALGNVRFKAGSCARKLVVRPAGIDVCSYDEKGYNFKKGLPGEEHINTWMGGRTTKFKVGDAGQQNNWSASLVLLNNDAGFTGCTDAVNGDYDLVVMPTHDEINNLLPTPLVRGTANPGTL